MKLATLGGLVFMVLGLPLAMAQAAPFPQEGPSYPLPGDEIVEPLEKAGVEERVSPLSCGAQPCLDPGDGRGGSNRSSNRICTLVCRTVCLVTQKFVCDPAPRLWKPFCRVVAFRECTKQCEPLCR